MATTDDNKLRSIAGILGVSSLALLGVTACDADDGATDDGAVEDDAGVEDDDAGMEDEGDDEDL